MAGWVKKIGHDTLWAKWDRKNTQKSNWLGEWKRLKCKKFTNDTTQSGLSELKEKNSKMQLARWILKNIYKGSRSWVGKCGRVKYTKCIPSVECAENWGNLNVI